MSRRRSNRVFTEQQIFIDALRTFLDLKPIHHKEITRNVFFAQWFHDQITTLAPRAAANKQHNSK